MSQRQVQCRWFCQGREICSPYQPWDGKKPPLPEAEAGNTCSPTASLERPLQAQRPREWLVWLAEPHRALGAPWFVTGAVLFAFFSHHTHPPHPYQTQNQKPLCFDLQSLVRRRAFTRMKSLSHPCPKTRSCQSPRHLVPSSGRGSPDTSGLHPVLPKSSRGLYEFPTATVKNDHTLRWLQTRQI